MDRIEIKVPQGTPTVVVAFVFVPPPQVPEVPPPAPRLPCIPLPQVEEG